MYTSAVFDALRKGFTSRCCHHGRAVPSPNRSIPLHPGSNPRMVRPTLFLMSVLVAGCLSEGDMSDVPSQMSGVPAPEYSEAVDSGRALALRHIAGQYLPSVSVAVGRGGEVVWAEAFGWADLTHETLATPETQYPVGSISKSLTATAAALLYERGLLDFDVPVQEYVPEYPEKRWPITTRQVMGHIAGVHNYGSSVALRQDHCDAARDGLADMAQDTLLFEPGERYRYSNYGFRLVGAIVEAAAGEPYLDFMSREVFEALGLERTIPDLEGQDLSASATKYDRGDFQTLRRAQDVDMSCSMAAGGFLSTPSELVHFGYGMLNAEILEQETIDLLWTAQRLNSGEPTNYGMGWSVAATRLGDDSGPTPAVGHGGAVLGGRASLMILPGEGMVVATMTNSRGTSPP